MRVPRFRFTVRGMMVAVAIVAVASALSRPLFVTKETFVFGRVMVKPNPHGAIRRVLTLTSWPLLPAAPDSPEPE